MRGLSISCLALMASVSHHARVVHVPSVVLPRRTGREQSKVVCKSHVWKPNFACQICLAHRRKLPSRPSCGLHQTVFRSIPFQARSATTIRNYGYRVLKTWHLCAFGAHSYRPAIAIDIVARFLTSHQASHTITHHCAPPVPMRHHLLSHSMPRTTRPRPDPVLAQRRGSPAESKRECTVRPRFNHDSAKVGAFSFGAAVHAGLVHEAKNDSCCHGSSVALGFQAFERQQSSHCSEP